MSEFFMVLLTAIIALLTFLVWRVYERMAWFTGAMESHSELMLRIEAKRGIDKEPIKLVWWDPTIDPPPITREHGQEVDMNTIYVFVPPQERRKQPSRCDRITALFKI